MKPQHVAIPTRDAIDNRPVLSFYAQLDSDRVVSSDTLTEAVEVRVVQ